ncbi:MAG: glycosyltransferase family 2 protein [Gammaproteobacteria bacterium]|nr:dolichol-phosphate mannosyltransferase [Gammaproteobacteria bacterium]
MAESSGPSIPELSIVVPVHNEADNVAPLVREIHASLRGSITFEVVFVDDGSTDHTAESIRRIAHELPGVRLLRHSRRCGQSVAIVTGVRAARAEWITTLDGDGQNDPADIPRFLHALAQDQTGRLKLIIGHRRTRRDPWLRRISSRIANGVRSALLHDATPDTGCGIKLFHRSTFLQLPVFNHMHRFLPALFQREGALVLSIDVHHRPRLRGTSKYGLFDRLGAGLLDLFGVHWLIRRAPPLVQAQEEAF